jgi:hypothetical protein
MSDSSPHGVPVNHKEDDQSHLMALRNKVKGLNPERNKSQSTVSQDHLKCDCYRHIKDATDSEPLTVCLNLDESSSDPSHPSCIGFCGCSDVNSHHLPLTMEILKCH